MSHADFDEADCGLRVVEVDGPQVGERIDKVLADKVAELGSPAASMAAQAVISQVKAAVIPLRDRNPDVFEHLSAAGSELLAAYRAAVAGQESRWTRGSGGGGAAGSSGPERIDLD